MTDGKIYIDKRGWKYKVMAGLGESNFKARYNRPDRPNAWKCMAKMPWRDTPEEAQADLDALAQKKGWKVAEMGS